MFINNRYVVISLGDQTVAFKYRAPELEEVTGPVQKGSGAVKMDKAALDRLLLQKSEKAAARDLEAQADVRMGLLRAFLRAKEAAGKAAKEFGKLAHKDKNNLIGGWSGLTKRIMREHFRLADEEDLDVVQDSFAKIAAGLSGDIVISDTLNRESGAEGYAVLRGGLQAAMDKEMGKVAEGGRVAIGRKMHELLSQVGLEQRRSMHIKFSLCETQSVNAVARIIVHEASHIFASTGDVCYYSDSVQYATLKTQDAIINADSYAFAAICLWLGKTVTSSELLGEKPAAITDGGKQPKQLAMKFFDLKTRKAL